MSPLTVSIGIPAYNEAQNIRELLVTLLRARRETFVLKEILVVCDGCTDDTVKLVRSLQNPLIRLIEHTHRRGQQVRQNEILRLFEGEVLVLLEADTLPETPETIDALVAPFLEATPSLGLVVGSVTRLKTRYFLEEVLNFGSNLKGSLFAEWRGGDNIYICHGHAGRALSRRFTEKLFWPGEVPEDAYMYLSLKESGFSLQRVPRALFLARNVGSISDRKRQVEKFLSGKKALLQFFPADMLNREYTLPKSLLLEHILRSFLRSPILTILYIVEVLCNRFYSTSRSRFNPCYRPYASSKFLKT